MSLRTCTTALFSVDSPLAGPPEPPLQPAKAKMIADKRNGANLNDFEGIFIFCLENGWPNMNIGWSITNTSMQNYDIICRRRRNPGYASAGSVSVILRDASRSSTHFSDRYGIYSVAVTKLQTYATI